MDTERTIAVALLCIGGWRFLLNWSAVFLSWRSGKFHSAIPLVGGLCLGVGASLLTPLRPYTWAAPFLDWGTIVVVVSLPWLVREMWKTCRLNLVEECVGVRGRTTVRLSLFRRGVAVVGWDISRPKGEHGMVGMSRLGTWEQSNDRLVLRLGDDEAILVPLDGEPGWQPLSWFGFGKDSEDLSDNGLVLKRLYPAPG